jgi:RimJ/RimL family protein N-acetyltransferase
MEPETLTTSRLLLRTVDLRDAPAVLAACQDPAIQRWTTIPSPYLPEHAVSFLSQQVPDGWRDGTVFSFGAFLRDAGTASREDDGQALAGGGLVAMLGISRRSMGAGEIGFWTAREHRRRGYVSEATAAVTRWAFTRVGIDRMEWRAEVGNAASRAVAEKAGFAIEGVLRSATIHQGVRRDCWVGSLLPSDLGLTSAQAYVPAPQRT